MTEDSAFNTLTFYALSIKEQPVCGLERKMHGLPFLQTPIHQDLQDVEVTPFASWYRSLSQIRPGWLLEGGSPSRLSAMELKRKQLTSIVFKGVR